MTGPSDLGLDLGAVLGGLKDFQRDTVAHVIDRWYGQDPVDRFLVADEVGLGKTLVAKGVIASAIERIRETQGERRIDVIYICSNADIARQNLARLNPTAMTELNFNDRLTMLPRALQRLRENRMNFIAFTPGTSFNLRSAEGKAQERVLLYHLLRRCWGSQVIGAGNPDRRVFQGWAGFERFKQQLDWFDPASLDDELVARFAQALRDDDQRKDGGLPLQAAYGELRDQLRWLRSAHPAQEVARRRGRFIGEVRELLAKTCIKVLDPSLVILDEFQRFRGLLDGEGDTAALAGSLLSHDRVKVLMLSATPYKMYTVRGELEDDHYADLLRTYGFLAGHEAIGPFAEDLRGFRRELLTAGDDLERVVAAKGRIEEQLRRVMVRTERLAASSHRGGMLTERPSEEVRLEARDVREFLGLRKVSQLLDAGGITDYWKSSGYPLNFMEGYQLDRKLQHAIEHDTASAELVETIGAADWLLDRSDIEAYRALDPGNARLRSMLHEVIEDGLWQVAWMPPSLAYHQPGPLFDRVNAHRATKRLVFSSWKVVPKVLAAVLSYEAERRMASLGEQQQDNTAEARRRFQPLLRIQRSAGRLRGMPVIGLLYPSSFLAGHVDPLQLATMPELSLDQTVSWASNELAEVLEGLTAKTPEDGAIDERWYWAAPMLLDAESDDADQLYAWWSDPELIHRWLASDAQELEDRTSFAEHLDNARTVISDPGQLGRTPDDLLEVVASLAIAGPGTVALRALGRIAPERSLSDLELRHEAASVAWTFRSLFNRPEITWLLRGHASLNDDARPYWRLALGHALAGNLQAVVDEHAHMLVEWCGVTDHEPGARVAAVTERMREALTTRAVNYRVNDVQAHAGKLSLEPYTMRGQFSVRFGDDRSEQEQGVIRQGHVRTAFNSPYWPFVLATTSVGQEGLDFHVYCHAVTHWNLPSNPVDLEQREGRVHRFKGHAVRKNVAMTHASVIDGSNEPWTQMFTAAADGREEGRSDLVPYWIYPVEGGATIERTVPALPLSAESRRLEELRRTVGAYRMVFGQPRQEDLVAFLRQHHVGDLETLGERLRIDLTPPRSALVVPRPRALVGPRWRPPGPAIDVVGGVTPRTRAQRRYRRFWSGVLDDILQQYPDWTTGNTPSKDSWMSLPAGITGIHYAAGFASNSRLRVELYVDPLRESLRPVAWLTLLSAREDLEACYTQALAFEDLPRSRASRIAIYYPDQSSIDREQEWPAYRNWLVATAGPFRDALQPVIDRIAEK
jgi:hypothetical protein